MLAEIRIMLRAQDPQANRMRAWGVMAGRDLLGDWTAEVRFGRIGGRGRGVTRVFTSEQAMQRFLRAALRRRATAPRRIGVAYRCAEACRAGEALARAAGISTQ